MPESTSLTIRSIEGNLEYDFVVAPGAKSDQIRMKYEGIEQVDIDATGNLVIEIGRHSFLERQPSIYLNDDGRKQTIEGSFVVSDEATVQFHLPDAINPNSVLIIDPKIVFSTYLGGADQDEGNSVAVDAEGAAYITGTTWSSRFSRTQFASWISGTVRCVCFKAKSIRGDSRLQYVHRRPGKRWLQRMGICIRYCG